MLVRNGPHHAADRQAVEIIVDENQDPQADRGKLGADPGFDMGFRPLAEGFAAACLVDQRDDHAKEHQENKDSHIIGIGDRCDETAAENAIHRIFQVEIVQHQCAADNSDK